MQTKNQEKLWNEFYQNGYYEQKYPSEQTVRYLSRYKKENGTTGKKLLDLGCGTGRHTKLATELDYETYAIDLSETATEKTKQLIKSHGWIAEIKTGKTENLPYPDNYFDIIISYGVLDHMKKQTIKKSIKEIKRTLKQNGQANLKLETNNSPEKKHGKTIAKNTRILRCDCEKGIIQYYYTKKDIKELFKEFKIINLEKEEIKNQKTGKLFCSRWHLTIQKKEAKP